MGGWVDGIYRHGKQSVWFMHVMSCHMSKTEESDRSGRGWWWLVPFYPARPFGDGAAIYRLFEVYLLWGFWNIQGGILPLGGWMEWHVMDVSWSGVGWLGGG